MVISWTTLLQTCAETNVGLNRIEEFLLLPEFDKKRPQFSFNPAISNVNKTKNGIYLKKCLTIDSSIGIIGEIGSGKRYF